MPKATTVRFTEEVFARLDEASARTGLPVNSIVVAACLEWMERHAPNPAMTLQALSTPMPAAPRWATLRRALQVARPQAAAYPFERFSGMAQELLARAQAEAQKAGFSYIGTEHLLLAALGDPESQATKILTSLSITEGDVRAALEKVLRTHTGPRASWVVPTSRVKKVIELAFKVCQGASDPHVSTGHVLVALVMEGDGIAAHVMKDLGATRTAVEQELAKVEPEA